MLCYPAGVRFALLALSLVVTSSTASADGQGVLIQRVDDRLVIGFDNGNGGQTIGGQAFGGVVGGDQFTETPSFLSLRTPPSGADALPTGVAVHWDFLPLTVDGLTSNLMHWDGASDFSLSPAADASLTLYDASFNGSAVIGAAGAVPGLRLGTTGETSFYRLHAHRDWYLSGPTIESPAAAGVYVTAMRVRMDGLQPSEPFFVAIGTPGAAALVDDTAVPWLEENADSLLMRGDYNFDGAVDAGDYALWASQYGEATPQPVDLGEADGNRDGVIDAADYVVWRNAHASPLSASAPVPEPSAIVLIALSGGIFVSRRTR